MRKVRTFKRLSMTLFSVVLTLGLLGGLAVPAHAVEVGAVVFVGTASVGPPGICAPLICPATKVTQRWTFSNTVGQCVGVAATAAGAKGLLPQAHALSCDIQAEGNLHDSRIPVIKTPTGQGPWCGHSGGSDGNGNLFIGGLVGGKNWTLRGIKWWVSAATIIPFTGTIENPGTLQSGPIAGVVSAVPTGGSCLAPITGQPPAHSFTVVGAAAAVIPN